MLSNNDFCKGLNSYFSSINNNSETISYLIHSSNVGNSYASYSLGLLLEKGEKVQKDLEKSRQFLQNPENREIHMDMSN